MKIIQSLAISAALAIAAPASLVTFAVAQTDTNKPVGSKPDSSAPMTDGEIRKVDKDTGKLTIKHGEIKNLDMPPMTMVFPVKDKSMVDKVKAGDKIKFRVINENGKMVVTEILAGQ